MFYGGNIMALFAHRRVLTQEELRQMILPVQQNLVCKFGVSDVAPGFWGLHLSAIQATWALEVDDIQPIRFYNDHASAHFVQRFVQAIPWEAGVLPCFRTLESNEEMEQIDPIYTLRIYLQQERSLQKAAVILRIHRNTLVYRIRRITAHCNLDLITLMSENVLCSRWIC